MVKILMLVAAVAAPVIAEAQIAPKTYRLEATPATVTYGYYWSDAKPALRISSGDIIDVDTGAVISGEKTIEETGKTNERRAG